MAGYVSAALVLGGVDCTGPHLHTVWPHGSTSTVPFVTMGSGSLAAMAVFENEYTRKEQINEEQAMEMVKRAILSGIMNDLGSGSNVDLWSSQRTARISIATCSKRRFPTKRTIATCSSA